MIYSKSDKKKQFLRVLLQLKLIYLLPNEDISEQLNFLNFVSISSFLSFLKCVFVCPNRFPTFFHYFINEQGLGTGIDPGIALTPLSSSVG